MANTDLNALIKNFNESATTLNMTAIDKRKLIDDICGCLGIGMWAPPESGTNFDVSDEDIERSWTELERAVHHDVGNCLAAYYVALMLATRWEHDALVRA